MAGNKSGAVVVTGASTGIGRATALFLDKKGYRVFAGVRKQADGKALEDAGSDRLTPITIDVAKERSIASAKAKVQRAVGKEGLVGLVNNAGVGGGGRPIEFMDPKDMKDTFNVNVVGQIEVSQAFIPMIRKAKGTIVLVASIGGRVASPFMSPYNVSKFGLEALGESMRHELKPWDIDVAVIEPGNIDTEIWKKADKSANASVARLSPTGKRLYGKQLSRMGEIIKEQDGSGISPDKVAKAIYNAISSDKPRHRYLVGTDAKMAAKLKGNLPDRTFHRMSSGRFKMPTDVPQK